jgi:hypothetical protein
MTAIDERSELDALINPPAASILRAEQVPPYGGDTQFTNVAVAYEGLSAPIRRHSKESSSEPLRTSPPDGYVHAVGPAPCGAGRGAGRVTRSRSRMDADQVWSRLKIQPSMGPIVSAKAATSVSGRS